MKENKKVEKADDAPETIPRDHPKKGEIKVTSNKAELFDANGKLREPKKSVEQQLEEQKIKDPSKAKQVDKIVRDAETKMQKAQAPKVKPEKVSIKNDKYSRISTYSVNQASSDREVKLLTELVKIKNIQILPKDSASFSIKTVEGNHSIGIIDTLKTSFSVKVGKGEQHKVSEGKEIDTILSDVRTELERISKLPSKKKTSGTSKAAPKNTIGKPELIERLKDTDSRTKKFRMQGTEITKTAREYAKKQKFKIIEHDNEFIFSR